MKIEELKNEIKKYINKEIEKIDIVYGISGEDIYGDDNDPLYPVYATLQVIFKDTSYIYLNGNGYTENADLNDFESIRNYELDFDCQEVFYGTDEDISCNEYDEFLFEPFSDCLSYYHNSYTEIPSEINVTSEWC